MPLLHIWDFVACYRVNFTFTLPLPVHIVPAPEFKHHIVDLLFALSTSLCTALLAIVSQLLHFAVTSTFVATKFCSALEINDIRSVAANFPDIITISVCAMYVRMCTPGELIFCSILQCLVLS